MILAALLCLTCLIGNTQCQDRNDLIGGASAPTQARANLVTEGEPGPSNVSHAADMVFIVSAGQARIGNDSSLVMLNVSTSAQYISKGVRAGVMPTKVLMDTKQGSRYLTPGGKWLGTPDAALMAVDKGLDKAVLLALADPVFHEYEQVLTFQISRVIPADIADLKTTGGLTARLVNVSNAGIGTPLPVIMAPNTVWTTVALFIEIEESIMVPRASTEGLMTELAEKAVGVVAAAGVNAAEKAATVVVTTAVKKVEDRKTPPVSGRRAA